jgi:TolA-binding protein
MLAGMVLMLRLMLAGCLALVATQRLEAANAEDRAFNTASESFNLTAYPKAEREFGEFVQKFPASSRISEAILFQSEARLAQSNYDGAIQLLSSHQKDAGTNADAYVFWLGEAFGRKGDQLGAIQNFGKLLSDFPRSSLRLETVIHQATALSRVGEWPRIISLLQQTNGIFQSVAATNRGSDLVLKGFLLLSEAQLNEGRLPEAEQTLRPFQNGLLNPTNAWQWQYLFCRVQLAEGKKEEALAGTSNLLAMAGNALEPALQAESISFQASLLENLGRIDAAIFAYTNNLRAAVPAERQRQALLKVTELSLKQGHLENAAQMLQRFLTQNPDAALADRGWLALGELRLREYVEASGTNLAVSTNFLLEAQKAFETLVAKHPESDASAKGCLDLGWCRWLANEFEGSREAFECALKRLPHSADQAVAQYKLGDVLFRQNDFQRAITNYTMVVENYKDLVEAQTNLCEPALYQIVRAGLAANDMSSVTNALAKVLSRYPNSYRTRGAILIAGQAVSRKGDAVEARNIFAEFLKQTTNTQMRAEVELAVGRTYEQERAWAKAAEIYETWITTFTNHGSLPEAEYRLAWATAQTGDETNALKRFTNFVARFPKHELTPQAQWWVADYHYNHGEYSRAENDYQLLAGNWPGTGMAYEARMQAGRAAFRHYGWADAADYFRNLYNETNCPLDLRYHALFALGSVYMSQDSTNKTSDYVEAIKTFDQICQAYGTNRLGALAWGEKASCYLQWAQAPFQLTNAVDAFQKVLEAPAADVTAKSIAKVGIGVVLERQAGQSPASEQPLLLQRALDHYLDVLSRADLKEGERPDLFWIKESGLKAVRLATDMQQWSVAEHVCERLLDLLPQLRPSLEERILKIKAQQGIAKAKD